MLKRTIYLLIAALVVVTSCKKDEKTDPPTPAEATVTMTSLGTELGSDISEAMSSEGVDAIFSAMNLMTSTDAFTNKKKSNSSANANITIADFAGTYTWDEAIGDFTVVSGTPSDKIIVKFPVDTNLRTDLNGLLTITDFVMVEVINEDDLGWVDTSYMPTRIAGNLLIDDAEVINIDFTAAYDGDEPTSIDATVTVVPISLSVDYEKTVSTITVNESLSLSGSVIQSVSGTANYVTVTDEYDTWDSVYYVDGFVHYDDIKIKGTVNIGEIDKASWNTDPTVELLNTNMDLSIYTYVDDHKMADIEFYNPNDTTIVPVQFILTDGTTLTFEQVVGPMIDEIDAAVIDNFDADHTPIDVDIPLGK